MLPSRHIIASLSLGMSVAFFAQSIYAGLLCFISGVLIDIDHFIEYLIHFGLKTFNLKEIYRSCGRLVRPDGDSVKRIYLFLHAGEIAILLWIGFIFFQNLYLLSIALGYTGHLIMDASTGAIRPTAYFISSRIKKGFATAKLIKNR